MFMRTGKLACRRTQSATVTVIEIRPFRNGWKCFETLGVEPKTGMRQRALPDASLYLLGSLLLQDEPGRDLDIGTTWSMRPDAHWSVVLTAQGRSPGTPKAFASRRLPLQHSSLSNFPRNLGSDFGQYILERPKMSSP